MISTLVLQKDDAGIAEMIADWKDGGEYDLHLRVRQIESGPRAANFEVLEATDETDTAPEEGAGQGMAGESDDDGDEQGGAMPAGAMKRVKPAIMIAFGHAGMK